MAPPAYLAGQAQRRAATSRAGINGNTTPGNPGRAKVDGRPHACRLPHNKARPVQTHPTGPRYLSSDNRQRGDVGKVGGHCPLTSNFPLRQLAVLDRRRLPFNFPRPLPMACSPMYSSGSGACQGGNSSVLTSKLRWQKRRICSGQTGQSRLHADPRLTVQIPLPWSPVLSGCEPGISLFCFVIPGQSVFVVSRFVRQVWCTTTGLRCSGWRAS